MNAVTMLERPTAIRRTPKTFLEREFPEGFGARFLTITPRIAGELLACNPENRSISATKVAHYAEDMKSGRWAVNGESVVIANDGTLIDGQHRLYGCVQANENFETLLCVGVARETRTTIDQGRARTVGDYLTMEGVNNAKSVAAVARRGLQFERSNGQSIDGKYLTHAEVMEYTTENADRLATSATYGTGRKSFSSAASASHIATWHYLLNAETNDLALEYLEQVIHGEGLHRTDPALTVRERLFQMGRSSLFSKTEAVLRGWVYFRDGKQLHRVQLMGEFPEL